MNSVFPRRWHDALCICSLPLRRSENFQPAHRDYDEFDYASDEGEFARTGAFAVGEMNEEGSVDESPLFEDEGDLFMDDED